MEKSSALFFLEGGRVTIRGVHYIKNGEALMHVAESEFAKDKTFGYHHSDLDVDYIEFYADQVKVENGLRKEVNRVIHQVEQNIFKGRTSVVYTSRKVVDLKTTD